MRLHDNDNDRGCSKGDGRDDRQDKADGILNMWLKMSIFNSNHFIFTSIYKKYHSFKPYIMDPFIGEIRLFAGDYAPQYWAYCDGSPLLIAQYEGLFSLIEFDYGGDMKTYFNLPTLDGVQVSGPTGIVLNYIIALYGILPPRQQESN
jgi:hypothetical protein